MVEGVLSLGKGDPLAFFLDQDICLPKRSFFLGLFFHKGAGIFMVLDHPMEFMEVLVLLIQGLQKEMPCQE